MATVTIELSDELYERLRERAERAGYPVDALLSALAAREAAEGAGITDEFIDDLRDMIEAYRPVLRRLAQ